ncbi:shootin-1-like isoform X3 [Haliotis rufescens]|uniref:shootin-1-like isoform X1 n=1 Tax=Haliotis rufescens TaxID=6454 RepID=UPI001EB033BA|nr:shootin-1-like isoform X1 [Haliotis rufescens]XP_048248024.1 shootin-1-like isoform X2 [Haliotis rufescens]XP_048248025.1 shootin-1-like isoform X3 [Haliotis rufescens]
MEQRSDADVDWKQKYKQSEETLKLLTSYCHRVVDKYEEVLKKQKENEAKFQALVQQVKDKDVQLDSVKELWQPAYQEYEVIKQKYELELECRFEAEHYATKVTKQNRNLKRMSQAILDRVDKDIVDGELEVSDLDLNKDSLAEEHLNSLNDKITELQEERCQLSAQFKQTWEDLHTERESHKNTQDKYDNVRVELKQTKEALAQHKDAFKQLTQASEQAFQEYESLRKEYEAAILCQNSAETFATELYANNAAMKRESSILLSKVANNPQLMKALHEVEELTEELEKLRAEHRKQVKDLEERISELSNKDEMIALETDNQSLLEERDSLSSRMHEVNQKYTQMEGQYADLQAHYKTLEEKYKDATKPPPAPPPPPPPPVVKKTFFRRKTKLKADVNKKLAGGGVSTNDGYSKALDEMMKRIKDGRSLNKVLKPVRKDSVPGPNSAMHQLHDVLNKMKRTRSEGDLTATVPGIDENSELAKAFRRVRKTDTENDDVFAPVHQSKSLPTVEEEKGESKL